MKGLMAVTATLAVVLGLFCLSPRSHAQDSPSISQTQDTGQQQDTKTFTGTLMKDGDKLVLKDEASNVTYHLDDQEKAKEHEGKQVRINGTLNDATNTIRVSSLEPSS
jgi:hypothetical protein